MSVVLPTLEEARELVPRRGGPLWRAASDVRTLSTAGYALVLQVAHPTVGAGVAQYSGFLDDPWGRLLRTLDYVHGTISGGPELAWAIGRRVRGIHKHIRGTTPGGRRYHALEPEAYAWVHATLASAFVQGTAVFGTPLTPAEREDLWEEWLRVGRLIGVRPRDLPERWAGFGPYFSSVVEQRLEDTPTVHLVLEALARPASPPLPVPPAVWGVLRRPVAAHAGTLTVGLLGPRLREKLGLTWTPGQQAAFRSSAALLRAATPLIRGPLAEFSPCYVRWRREQLRRGDVASHVPARRDPPALARPVAAA